MTEKNKSETDENVKSSKKPVSKKATLVDNNSDEFLNSFNWHQYQEGIDKIDEKQIKEFEKLVQANFVDTSDDNIILGEVIHLTERDVIIDINAKSEGVISRNEFRYNPDLKVGDKVEVIVDIREDKTGQLILSHKKARTIKAWDKVNEEHDKNQIVQGYVKYRKNEGMIDSFEDHVPELPNKVLTSNLVLPEKIKLENWSSEISGSSSFLDD